MATTGTTPPFTMSVTASYVAELVKFAFREGYRACAAHHHITPDQKFLSEKELADAYNKFKEENAR